MENKGATVALLIVLAAGLALYLTRRRQLMMTPAFPDSENINDNVASPAQNAAYWASAATGDPALAGSFGAGAVSPAIGLRRPVPWGVSPMPWTAPNAGARPAGQVAASRPIGRWALPGPVAPGASTPQSPVSSTSPFLPANLPIIAPLAANAWYYDLSKVDPYIAMAAGSGGYIDVSKVDMSQILPEK